jgi:ribose/xylose/arabinose/galactoside ABC-type transport system permease subunit
MILNYMTIKGVPGEWQQAVTGLIILVVATADRLARRGGEAGL